MNFLFLLLLLFGSSCTFVMGNNEYNFGICPVGYQMLKVIKSPLNTATITCSYFEPVDCVDVSKPYFRKKWRVCNNFFSTILWGVTLIPRVPLIFLTMQLCNVTSDEFYYHINLISRKVSSNCQSVSLFESPAHFEEVIQGLSIHICEYVRCCCSFCFPNEGLGMTEPIELKFSLNTLPHPSFKVCFGEVDP